MLIKYDTQLIILGFVVIPGAAGGSVVVWIIGKCFKLDVQDLLKMCIIFLLICLAVMTGFLLNCDAPHIVGVTTLYTHDM